MKRRILTVLSHQHRGVAVDVEVGGYFFTMSRIMPFKSTINGCFWGAAVLVFACLTPQFARAGALEDGIAAYDKRDFVTAATKWREAAEAGNAEAQRRLADLLASDEAFLTGTFTGPLEDGALAYERKDFSTAAVKFREAAEQGNSEAQRQLGNLLYFGLGVPKDDNAAEAWLRRAAEQGNGLAAFSLSTYWPQAFPHPTLILRRACDKYVTEAVKWWRKAAEQGDIEAQWQVGRSYYVGWCLETNKSDGFKWIRRAAEQGHTGAQSTLARMYMDGTGIKKDATLALKWWRKAAEQDDVNAWGAQKTLAEALWNGDGVKKNTAEAVYWFQRFERKIPVSDVQYMLGLAYFKGEGVPQDYKRAFDWFMKAAFQDDTDAQRAVGLLYTRGQGVAQDYVLAHMWLNLAAAKGTTNAAELREDVAKLMTPAQIAEAQRLAREWKPASLSDMMSK